MFSDIQPVEQTEALALLTEAGAIITDSHIVYTPKKSPGHSLTAFRWWHAAVIVSTLLFAGTERHPSGKKNPGSERTWAPREDEASSPAKPLRAARRVTRRPRTVKDPAARRHHMPPPAQIPLASLAVFVNSA